MKDPMNIRSVPAKKSATAAHVSTAMSMEPACGQSDTARLITNESSITKKVLRSPTTYTLSHLTACWRYRNRSRTKLLSHHTHHNRFDVHKSQLFRKCNAAGVSTTPERLVAVYLPAKAQKTSIALESAAVAKPASTLRRVSVQ
jgi:hypothetical protein